ncbi:LPXTG cell wall anchor domain-containing protein [Enterococcus hulanensis]|uniref:LPXTG cell wall anchor domain-containing protein n=1 Tax=Enterococcus hulanensis TaxID=2559929 RepID=A0ABU3EX89_9ENTE|nr:LPXTG cell wall anchor domain-containing protein [Enterococcus hulanensis]MDT2598561.1 LPXTG cell wall anchor domain-containing protein [Enterococcus hulanensis]MDT2607934.1 LPXTG cell wall anchor domain-containing protein [Enterococcus hulanensis]MDT2615229.1 LPXTG cell wall anchor domain-containing protein [Enterococcus hulanensis]MDT2626800.1 LPXTG cell wall anchor domain-containing protein [Enterococcus hulanensis]MDT2654301.1 LPXTG cell wall anchor domain-containing protein [Enterococc
MQKFVIPKRQTLDGKTISVDHETYGGAKDGHLTGIFTTMEYRRTGSDKWLKGTTDGTIKNLSPGSYEIRQAGSNAEQKFASLPITKEIKTGVPKAKMPQLSLNYEGETLDGLDVSATYQLTLDGKEYLVKGIKSYAIPPEMFGKDIKIVQVGDGKDSLNSDPQNLMIKARPVIDTKVIQAIKTSGQKKQDGQLKGITADMEYRISGTSAWHQGTKEGVISNLYAGTYEIRYSSSNEKQRFASASIEKIIGTSTESVPTGPSEKPSAGKPVPKQPANKTQNTKVQAGQISKAIQVEKPSVKTRPKSLLKAGDETSYNMILVGIGLLAVLTLYWKKRYKKS